MKKYDIDPKDGIAIMMEQPTPGIGGRHRLTRTYGRSPNFNSTPRNELARDIIDMKRIYEQDGVYNLDINSSFQKIIHEWKHMRSDLFIRRNNGIY